MSSSGGAGGGEMAIAVRGVSKCYVIQHQRQATLREAIAHRLRHPFARNRRETFWALRDVSLDVRRGEVLGIIGRNGAGKSTLLKILSRISEPTTGKVALWGRVGSLLEVGTGFHPELTGRENVFLNGSILGMSRREIRACFDRIVDFAGVEQFLDTPVKRYSSGMRVRLAFAVAAHLRPEILIVDEVLAVGDADFQRKCLSKMDEVARSGRTVLLVSHNLGTMRSLCTRVAYFERGQLLRDGGPDEVVAEYLQRLQTSGGSIEDDPDSRHGDGTARLRAVRVLAENGQEVNSVLGGQDLTLEMDYVARAAGGSPTLRLNVYNEMGVAVSAAHTDLTRPELPPLARQGRLRLRLRRLALTPGSYRIAALLEVDGRQADYLPRAATLEVVASVFYPTGQALDWRRAAFHLDHEWEHDPIADDDVEPAADVKVAGG